MEQPWHSTTDELRNREPMIRSKIYLEQQIKTITGNNGDGGGRNGGGKRRHNRRQGKGGGGGKGNDNNNHNNNNTSFDTDPRGNENSPFRKCKWCKKKHKGKCKKPWPPAENDGTGFNKQELFSMIGSAIDKKLKKSRRDDESDSDDDDRKRKRRKQNWRKGKDEIAQALTVWKAYGKNAYESDCSMDSQELEKHSKGTKEFSKQFKRL